MKKGRIIIDIDDDNRWQMRTRSRSGKKTSKTYGSRQAISDVFITVLSEVRGIPFPSIDMTPDETITIGTPQRRSTD